MSLLRAMDKVRVINYAKNDIFTDPDLSALLNMIAVWHLKSRPGFSTEMISDFNDP